MKLLEIANNDIDWDSLNKWYSIFPAIASETDINDTKKKVMDILKLFRKV